MQHPSHLTSPCTKKEREGEGRLLASGATLGRGQGFLTAGKPRVQGSLRSLQAFARLESAFENVSKGRQTRNMLLMLSNMGVDIWVHSGNAAMIHENDLYSRRQKSPLSLTRRFACKIFPATINLVAAFANPACLARSFCCSFQ